MNKPDFILLMYGLTSEQRLEAYRQFNHWEWPSDLSLYKPEGFDGMKKYNPRGQNDSSVIVASPEWIELSEALHTVTSEWERSWSHNRKPLTKEDRLTNNPHMTQEEHCKWWREKNIKSK